MINTHDHEINELYAEVERMHPHLAEVAFTDWAEKNPRMVKEYLLEKKCGKHLNKYSSDDSLHTLSKILNVNMPLWSVADLKAVLEGMGYAIVDDKLSGKDYTIYDVNFLAQKERLVHKSLGTDAKRFITMAIEDLDFDDELAYEYYHRLGDIYEIED